MELKIINEKVNVRCDKYYGKYITQDKVRRDVVGCGRALLFTEGHHRRSCDMVPCGQKVAPHEEGDYVLSEREVW
jgi:hypothetical protein